jgi:hypothetical protein
MGWPDLKQRITLVSPTATDTPLTYQESQVSQPRVLKTSITPQNATIAVCSLEKQHEFIAELRKAVMQSFDFTDESELPTTCSWFIWITGLLL